MADHRLAVPARDVSLFATAIARALKIEGVTEDNSGRLAGHASWISALVRDLENHRGKGLVVAGAMQPPAVHALVHAINASLGNLGETVTLHAPRDRGPADRVGSLPDLARDIDRGVVDTLLILGANPAYDAPADLNFAAALASNKIGLRIHLGLYEDETAGALPLAHPGGALPRDLERHQGVRRDGHDPAAADRPLVPGAVRARGARGVPG